MGGGGGSAGGWGKGERCKRDGGWRRGCHAGCTGCSHTHPPSTSAWWPSVLPHILVGQPHHHALHALRVLAACRWEHVPLPGEGLGMAAAATAAAGAAGAAAVDSEQVTEISRMVTGREVGG